MRVELSQRTQGLLAFLSYDTALPCTTAMAHAHAVMSHERRHVRMRQCRQSRRRARHLHITGHLGFYLAILA